MEWVGQTLLSRYRIDNVLGQGGFGDTYLAKDLALPGQPYCVVKHLRPKDNNPEFFAIAKNLFEREAETLYRLGEHDAIPRLFAHFEQAGEFFLVQEYIQGHDLSVELLSHQPWPEEKIKGLLDELLEVLSFLHSQNVIHRDLKPQNIMRRDRDRKLFLIDFGAVKEIPRLALTSPGKTGLTVAIGSPGYMPSEQAAGKPKPASDIYALGMIGIQALTGLEPGQLPIDPNTGEMIWPKEFNHGIGIVTVLQTMVRDHFSQRYRDAMATQQALAQSTHLSSPTEAVIPIPPTEILSSIQASVPPSTSPPSGAIESSSPQKSTVPWIIAGASFVFALGAGIILVTQPWTSSVNITKSNQGASSNQTSSSSIDINVSRKNKNQTIKPTHSDATTSQEPSADNTDPQASKSQSPPPEVTPSNPLTSEVSQASANKSLVSQQTITAFVIDPPSNIRAQPNGDIICSVSAVQAIPIGPSLGEWFETTFCNTEPSGYIHQSQLSLTVGQALVIDPPSNVRSQPNRNIICSVKGKFIIKTYGTRDGWYRTDACQSGRIGYIHNSQVNIQR